MGDAAERDGHPTPAQPLFTKLFKTRPLISTFSRGAITTSSFVVTSP